MNEQGSGRGHVLRQYVEEIGLHGVLSLLAENEQNRKDEGWERIEKANEELHKQLEQEKQANRDLYAYVNKRIYEAAGFLCAEGVDTFEDAIKLIENQHKEANALVADTNYRINTFQAELDDLREYKRETQLAYDTPIDLIRETRDKLKTAGFQVPEGAYLLGSVNKALDSLRHINNELTIALTRKSELQYELDQESEAHRALVEKFDTMEKTLMAERDQAIKERDGAKALAKAWESTAGEWKAFFDREHDALGYANGQIAEQNKLIDTLTISRNLYKDGSSNNYERARAAELKLIKIKMQEPVVVNTNRINNPCAHCGEQIPIEHAAIYNVNEGYGLHFACESAFNAANDPIRPVQPDQEA